MKKFNDSEFTNLFIGFWVGMDIMIICYSLAVK